MEQRDIDETRRTERERERKVTRREKCEQQVSPTWEKYKLTFVDRRCQTRKIANFILVSFSQVDRLEEENSRFPYVSFVSVILSSLVRVSSSSYTSICLERSSTYMIYMIYPTEFAVLSLCASKCMYM